MTMKFEGIPAMIAWGFYPISLLLTSVASGVVLCLRRDQSARNAVVTLLKFHLAIYAASFLLECVHPYWEDNGVRAFIPLGDRWRWAFGPSAGLIELVLIVIVVVTLIFRPRRKGYFGGAGSRRRR